MCTARQRCIDRVGGENGTDGECERIVWWVWGALVQSGHVSRFPRSESFDFTALDRIGPSLNVEKAAGRYIDQNRILVEHIVYEDDQ